MNWHDPFRGYADPLLGDPLPEGEDARLANLVHLIRQAEGEDMARDDDQHPEAMSGSRVVLAVAIAAALTVICLIWLLT